ncbi:MAG: glycogen/starch synthase [Bacteroides sp.]|nr:glycogen/starch synthase [Bacteroides sp.]MCM1413111.1 glycogen/starch synthase [Bacteroides sp.]MCM1472147.1 glycogen/starch synthase [Bacteroides sp.]
MDNEQVDVDLLIETSWEVCNKVGGIYTVLSTKAKTLHQVYKDKLIFIGPDVWGSGNESPYFAESATLLKAWKNSAALPEGLTVRVGRWLVPGRPLAILVKFDALYAVKDQFYGKMWDLYGVDSLHAYGDYDEACAFGHASGLVIESLYNYFNDGDKNVIAHFDEWTTGMGLLYTKWKLPRVATIFTTHATSIGRSICGNGKPLYDYLSAYNGDQMAQELNMQSKHSLEKAAAHQADCFTTVSDITAAECTQLLGRKPDVVTPNGFEPNFVPAKSRFASSRSKARKKLLEVASALTGKKLADDTLIIGTSGRCEYRNKGIDLFLDSIKSLESFNPSRQVLAYVMVPAWSGNARTDLRDALEHNTANRLNDPYITHDLHNYNEDPIISRIHSLGFANSVSSNITVIYVPCYLNGTDGIFDMTYYDLLIGMDATVFPSYYEPWGYTPLESIAFGVPTITTSLSGFGQWIMRTSYADALTDTGVYVVERNDSNYAAVVDSIARTLMFLCDSDEETMSEIRKSAVATAAKANWSLFIKYYYEAFAIALNNEKRREKETQK